ncbi:MAG: glycosyl hydrolase family 18 protein, partial [Candidatus Marinimicrobia bacterium]|nr:glycosyl hydrolase family 18 protein [Candidatus Neomarinimicrobiota bacterium]
MKKTIIIFLILITTISYSQERKGVHQIEWEKHQNVVEVFQKRQSAEDIIPLNKTLFEQKAMSKVVFGYLPYWERSSAPQYFQYDILTHIALFSFGASPTTGSLSNPSGWPWTSIINEAHNNGVKVIMCVTQFDDSKIHTIITDATIKNNFFSNVKSKIETYNFDGVNIDFEGLYYDDRENNINPFMQELTDYIHTNVGSDQEISFAGPVVNWGGHWDLVGLANACDYIFIMGYAFWGNWSSTTGPSAPLEGGTYNIKNALTNSSNGYGSVTANNPEKLILGFPYYGNKWKTENQYEGSNTEENGSSIFYTSAVDKWNTYGKKWSSKYKVPWTAWQDGTQWYQVWCEDDSSLGLKYDFVIEKNIKGTGMWALGYDGDRDELWDKLREKFYYIPNTAPIITDLPDTISFVNDTLAKINIWNFVSDNETSTSSLEFLFTSLNDSVFTEYDPALGILTITSDTLFSGVAKLEIEVSDGEFSTKDTLIIYVSVPSVEEIIPEKFILRQNYPNPFNPKTTIKYDIINDSFVKLNIYNLKGEKVKTLVNKNQLKGKYSIEFDGSNLASG